MNYEEIVKNFISNKIITDDKYKNVGFKDPLIENGIIDSLGILKMIAFIEEEFNIVINDSDIIPENFENIEAIVSFIINNRS